MMMSPVDLKRITQAIDRRLDDLVFRYQTDKYCASLARPVFAHELSSVSCLSQELKLLTDRCPDFIALQTAHPGMVARAEPGC